MNFLKNFSIIYDKIIWFIFLICLHIKFKFLLADKIFNLKLLFLINNFKVFNPIDPVEPRIVIDFFIKIIKLV